jgi:SAM-dependent methyltransferase
MATNPLSIALSKLFQKKPQNANELQSPFHFVNQISEVHDFFYDFNLASDPFLQQPGSRPGHCYICDIDVFFEVDRPTDGSPVNWRETLVCPECRMINRWRGCVHLFEAVCDPNKQSRIYITEALTPVADLLRSRYPALKSSEYIESADPGEIVNAHLRSIRNEDVTRLSFKNKSFDALLTFDVLEHVPYYRLALMEFYRVLNDDGRLILTAPFSFQQEGVTRAKLDADGQVHHLMEPCFHGDPMSDEGVLAFYDFGMELLDELREIGFVDNSLALWNAHEWGYAGANVAFISRKAK